MSMSLAGQVSCPICQESLPVQGFSLAVATQCGHLFCATCMTSHLRTGSRMCPVCRTEVSRTSKVFLGESHVPMLSEDAISWADRLSNALHEVWKTGPPCSMERLENVSKLLQAFTEAAEASNVGPTLESLVMELKQHATAARRALSELRYQKHLCNHLRRWSSWLRDEQQTLLKVERRSKLCSERRRALRHREQLALVELNAIAVQMRQELREHQATIGQLNSRLQELRRLCGSG
ncbi:hypothetical protein C8T65DRAFT_644102 [Cerioporus squamosus]|nr:hypothetical protein C8T65DRAFT_644102 [Cerioporus squamosus]